MLSSLCVRSGRNLSEIAAAHGSCERSSRFPFQDILARDVANTTAREFPPFWHDSDEPITAGNVRSVG